MKHFLIFISVIMVNLSLVASDTELYPEISIEKLTQIAASLPSLTRTDVIIPDQYSLAATETDLIRDIINKYELFTDEIIKDANYPVTSLEIGFIFNKNPDVATHYEKMLVIYLILTNQIDSRNIGQYGISLGAYDRWKKSIYLTEWTPHAVFTFQDYYDLEKAKKDI